MRYERDLQVKLREKYRRIYKTGYQVYEREILYFRDWVLRTPALKAIIEALPALKPDLNADEWIAANFGHYQNGYDWSPTPEERALVVWRMVCRWADGEDAFTLAHTFSYEGTGDAILREMTEQAIEPFIEYLEEHLSTESEILHLLERCKRRLEAFDQVELHERYEADTKHGEAVYDRYVRKFLFDEGIDYPFSQPASASGSADVVSGMDGDDPLVCEIKLYGTGSYGVPYVAKGFHQAVSYAQDYGKTVAHLVVFNLGDEGLQLPSDEGTRAWPPRLHVEGVTVYMVVIQAKPLPSASNRGTASPRVVSRDELVKQPTP